MPKDIGYSGKDSAPPKPSGGAPSEATAMGGKDIPPKVKGSVKVADSMAGRAGV